MDGNIDQPAAPPATVVDDGSVSITLSKPLRYMDKEVTELRFREPTAADIERYGFPLIMEDGDTPETADPTKPSAPEIRFDAKSMTAHLSALSGVPIVNIRKISGGDWLRCAYRVSPFFLS